MVGYNSLGQVPGFSRVAALPGQTQQPADPSNVDPSRHPGLRVREPDSYEPVLSEDTVPVILLRPMSTDGFLLKRMRGSLVVTNTTRDRRDIDEGPQRSEKSVTPSKKQSKSTEPAVLTRMKGVPVSDTGSGSPPTTPTESVWTSTYDEKKHSLKSVRKDGKLVKIIPIEAAVAIIFNACGGNMEKFMKAMRKPNLDLGELEGKNGKKKKCKFEIPMDSVTNLNPEKMKKEERKWFERKKKEMEKEEGRELYPNEVEKLEKIYLRAEMKEDAINKREEEIKREEEKKGEKLTKSEKKEIREKYKKEYEKTYIRRCHIISRVEGVDIVNGMPLMDQLEYTALINCQDNIEMKPHSHNVGDYTDPQLNDSMADKHIERVLKNGGILGEPVNTAKEGGKDDWENWVYENKKKDLSTYKVVSKEAFQKGVIDYSLQKVKRYNMQIRYYEKQKTKNEKMIKRVKKRRGDLENVTIGGKKVGSEVKKVKLKDHKDYKKKTHLSREDEEKYIAQAKEKVAETRKRNLDRFKKKAAENKFRNSPANQNRRAKLFIFFIFGSSHSPKKKKKKSKRKIGKKGSNKPSRSTKK